MKRLILASGSRYRRQLLDKLELEYSWRTPEIDESPLPDEQPRDLVMRLARNKAIALVGEYPDSLIIGSDQVAVLNDEILGKPLNHQRAKQQLSAASGQQVMFLTGLCLLNSATHHSQLRCETYSVVFRSLSERQIDNYIAREAPYDCAGSFKSEGLGITLFEQMAGDDPNTLIGLPLIALIDMLNEEGVNVLT